ncbi:MAG TPA: tetratricopeptide repeat protein [Pirellulales bacterium]|nr:tetratricopeptide repeat protein [Pirellulales bacterium]
MSTTVRADSNLAASAASPAELYWIWGVSACLVLTVGLVFGQTLGHPYLGYDDQVYVYNNPYVKAGLTLEGLWWALTDGPFNEWYPMTSLSHMLDGEMYGVQHPAGHYLTNVVLHAASSVLLFLVLLRMTGQRGSSARTSLWPSAWVAAVFAVHPLHVESVAWLAERRDVLSGLFFMLTLGAYALYVERPSLGRYLAVAGMLALGLMSKPILVTVPCLLLLLDYWPLRRFRSVESAILPGDAKSWLGRLPVPVGLVVEKIPLLALAAATLWIHLSSHGLMMTSYTIEPLTRETRVANALISYVAYLGQSFYPSCLALIYPHPGNHVPTAEAAEAFALLAAITAVAAYGWRRWPYLLVGWLWFLGMLVPVIGLVGDFEFSRADRYMYLSQIGLSLAVAWSVWTAFRALESRRAAEWHRWMLATVAAASILVLAIVAGRQTAYWSDPAGLWLHTIACTAPNSLAQNCLASVYGKEGKPDQENEHLRIALSIGFNDRERVAMAHSHLAANLKNAGKNDEALREYELAAQAYAEGAIYHARFAGALTRAGRHEQAAAEWRETARLDPKFPRARLAAADALLSAGDVDGAVAACRELLRENPDSSEAMVILGTALEKQGNDEEAIVQLEQALQRNPGNVPAHVRLGLLLDKLGESRRALQQLMEAIRLEPDNPTTLWQTAWILATSPDSSARDGSRAVELANRAIQHSQGHEVRAYDALAAGLAERGNFSAAAAAAERASALAFTGGDRELADAIDQRIRLYRQSMPYRQPEARGTGRHAPAESQ